MTTTCPACKKETLAYHQLEANLGASKCTKCAGIWINSTQYEHWLNALSQRPSTPASADGGVRLSSGERPKAKFCPQCKYILTKYKVGHGVDFSLNRCAHCGGMWFDQNEWEILASRNMHVNVHSIFSASWQQSVRSEEHQAAMTEIWRDLLGEADLAEIKRIKEWLQNHPQAPTLYAFLLGDAVRDKTPAKG